MDHVEAIIDFLFDLGIRTFAMNGMISSGGGYQDPNAIPEDELPPLLIRVRDHSIEKGMRFLWYTPTEYCRMSPVELELGAKRCNAGEYSICIEPNGNVLPCQSYYVTAGNILIDDWKDIWNSELFTSFRDREKNPQLGQLPEKCWSCSDLPLCGGGCRIERQAREGIRINSDLVKEYSPCPPGQMKEKPNSLAIGFLPSDRSTVRKKRSTGVANNLIHLSVDPSVHPSNLDHSKSGKPGSLESTNGACKCS
jgi:radical SAM protein with 4Fe4S-binding SPASM domain